MIRLLQAFAVILILAGLVLLFMTRSGAISIKYVPLVAIGLGVICFRASTRINDRR